MSRHTKRPRSKSDRRGPSAVLASGRQICDGSGAVYAHTAGPRTYGVCVRVPALEFRFCVPLGPQRQ